jgi:outer membrane protein TolC
LIKLYKTSCYSIGIFAFIHIGIVSAQSLPPFSDNNERYKPIIISTFLDEVNSNNGTLKVRRLGADSATAISQRAGNLLLSPIITYARGSMYTQSPYVGYNNPSSNTLGAMVTVEGWGKRSAREAQALAEANRLNTEMITESKTIETEAIFAYIDALRTKLLWQSYQEAIIDLASYQSPLAKKNILDFKDIQKVLENDLKFYAYSLINYLGKSENELPLPIGTLNLEPKSFQISELISQANSNRADITSTQAAIESASANLEVIKASKNIDVMPGIYYSETPPYSSSGTSYGSQKSFSFIVSVPLSNALFNDSDVLSAVNAQTQQEIMLQATKTKIITELNQTYLQYQSAKNRLESSNKAYQTAKDQKNNGITGVLAFREAQGELFDARTIHAKTLILLQRLSGDFQVPKFN